MIQCPTAAASKGLAAVLVVVLLAVASAGCSRQPRLVPVTGKVTFDREKPPFGGILTFLPEEGEPPLRPGMGSFDAEGTLRVSSLRDSDGLRPGRYRVEIRCASSTGTDHDPGVLVDHVPAGFTPPELVVPESGSVVYSIDVPKKPDKR